MDVEEIKPIRCSICGKLFLCRGRYNLFHKLEPTPYSKDCLMKDKCECEECHVGNRGDPICGNLLLDSLFNPSSREWK